MIRDEATRLYAESIPAGSFMMVCRDDVLRWIPGSGPQRSSNGSEHPAQVGRSNSIAGVTSPSPDLVPLAEFARRVGRSTKTVRRWIQSGALAGVKKLPGRGGYMIPRDAGVPVEPPAPPIVRTERARLPKRGDL